MSRNRPKLTADLKSAPPNHPRQLFISKVAKILLPSFAKFLPIELYKSYLTNTEQNFYTICARATKIF